MRCHDYRQDLPLHGWTFLSSGWETARQVTLKHCSHNITNVPLMHRNWELMKLGLPGMSQPFGSSKPSLRCSYMARFSLQGVPWVVLLGNKMGITLEELVALHPDWHWYDSHVDHLAQVAPYFHSHQDPWTVDAESLTKQLAPKHSERVSLKENLVDIVWGEDRPSRPMCSISTKTILASRTLTRLWNCMGSRKLKLLWWRCWWGALAIRSLWLWCWIQSWYV